MYQGALYYSFSRISNSLLLWISTWVCIYIHIYMQIYVSDIWVEFCMKILNIEFLASQGFFYQSHCKYLPCFVMFIFSQTNKKMLLTSMGSCCSLFIHVFFILYFFIQKETKRALVILQFIWCFEKTHIFLYLIPYMVILYFI